MSDFETNLIADADDSVIAALKFAEKSWKDASQANFSYEKRLREATEKYEAQIKQLSAENKQLRSNIEIWRTAYETVVNSKTWKMARKLKKIVGKKQ